MTCVHAHDFYVFLRKGEIVVYYAPVKKQTTEQQPMKVILATSLLSASDRDVASGVFRHLQASPKWELRLMQPEENPLTVEKLRAAEKSGVAGVFLTDCRPTDLIRELAKSSIPVVAIGMKSPILQSRKGPTAFVLNDNAGIGEMGARHFLKLGKFNSFGFDMTRPDSEECMAERARAFRDTLRTAAPGVCVKNFIATDAPGSDDDLAAIASWISALPKPAAVMAGCDWRAVQILAACNAAHVRVPDAVALLGVDNDEFLCEHANPPLSSVLPGHEEMGSLAAREMARLLCGRAGTRHKVVSVPPMKVVERESSRVRSTAAALVDRAKRFIVSNAVKGIGVEDVVEHLHVSRRLAEMRYRAATGRTMRDSIEAVRMAKLKRLLVATDRPISALAAACGFNDANALSHLFRKRFGISMRDYRARNRSS